jgi:peptidoglycan/LPS O-acetylase OafA/YrhL
VLPLLPVVLVWFGYFDLLGGAGWRAFLADVTLLTFWTKGFRTEWFVALILVLYAVYPLLWRLRTAKLGAVWMWLLIAAFVVLNAAWAKAAPVSYERTEIAFSRVPSFLLGLLVAPWCEEDKKAPRGTTAALLALFVLLFAFKFRMYLLKPWSRLINAPLGFLLTLLLAQLCAAVKDAPVLRSAEKFFAFLGGFTLELYLLHEKVLYCLLRLGVPRIWRGTLVSAAAIVLAIPIAWCYSRVCAALRGCLARK